MTGLGKLSLKITKDGYTLTTDGNFTLCVSERTLVDGAEVQTVSLHLPPMIVRTFWKNKKESRTVALKALMAMTKHMESELLKFFKDKP